MGTYRTIVLDGGLAAQNPFPEFVRTDSDFRLEGTYAPEGGVWERRDVPLSPSILPNGLLILGSAGAGKTNVINRLTDQILQSLSADDFAVILDVKGDYLRTFYQEGDWILSPTSSDYCWNIFDDLLPFRSDRRELDSRIREMCQYLFAGRESTQQPFFVNAARDITACMLKFLIYEAEEKDDYRDLNNQTLVRLLNGQRLLEGCEDAYDVYRMVLETYEEFRGALIYLPPKEQRNESGDGVLSEVISMAQDMFSGAFGAVGKKGSISGTGLLHEHQGRVLFLEYNPALGSAASYVFRLVLDWTLSCVLDSSQKASSFGKAYFILDEMAVLPELRYLDRALNLMRSKFVGVVGALQNVAQIYATYPENKAHNILDAFQSMIVLRSETASIRYVKSRFGNVLARREFSTGDGGLEISQPQTIPAVEDYEIARLERGMAFVKLLPFPPFRFQFFPYICC